EQVLLRRADFVDHRSDQLAPDVALFGQDPEFPVGGVPLGTDGRYAHPSDEEDQGQQQDHDNGDPLGQPGEEFHRSSARRRVPLRITPTWILSRGTSPFSSNAMEPVNPLKASSVRPTAAT